MTRELEEEASFELTWAIETGKIDIKDLSNNTFIVKDSVAQDLN